MFEVYKCSLNIEIEKDGIMKYRALVLDDDDVIRSLLSTILVKRGYDVRSFSFPGSCPLFNNHECICTAEEACADIILSDVRMPQVSGMEFIERLFENGCKVKHMAFISGSWSDREYAQAEIMGCKTFNKPFSVSELEKWLDACEKDIAPDRVLREWE
jgi:CheY-like chemotaxis protein